MTIKQERVTTRMRALLARPVCTVAPGVADAFGARLVKMEGFEAVYHMHQPNAEDSTGYKRHGTAFGNVNGAGLIGTE